MWFLALPPKAVRRNGCQPGDDMRTVADVNGSITRRARMPLGSQRDGRYRLRCDDLARLRGNLNDDRRADCSPLLMQSSGRLIVDDLMTPRAFAPQILMMLHSHAPGSSIQRRCIASGRPYSASSAVSAIHLQAVRRSLASVRPSYTGTRRRACHLAAHFDRLIAARSSRVCVVSAGERTRTGLHLADSAPAAPWKDPRNHPNRVITRSEARKHGEVSSCARATRASR